ncbi:uncharacterized protein LOC116133545 [Pistacia vera]|uniref:uncharacterized protein LOC116133545 n=1 Tax=Pistacia vera TaxID=55513 RepID=UPI001262D05B|nr:uncharacterized protein LOC116133545 [Pistacia vera]
MMSTVGLELTNFLNPDLTWKTVAKGNRSATRRTRKPFVRNFTAGVELADKSPKRAENGTVSESEKLGVAVLGRRFSDKIEHVPIKKRKFNLRSPSPPPCSHHSSSRGCYPNSNGKRQHRVIDASTEASSPGVKGEISDGLNGKLGCREDFSGIEILAAAACDNNFDVDQDKENKVVEESLCEDDSKPVEEKIASIGATNLSNKDLALEDKKDVSSFQDFTTSSAQKSPNEGDKKGAEKSVPSRDDRLHWDLNVVIDAWEQPCDIENVGSQANPAMVTSVVGSGKLHGLEGGEIEKETKEIKHDEAIMVDSSEVHGEMCIPSDPRDLLHGSNGMDHQLETCSDLDCCHDECGDGAKAYTQVVSTDACLNNVAFPSNTAGNIVLPDCLEEETEGCATGVQEEEIVCIENVEVEKCAVASSFGPALERVTCEVDSSTLVENAEDSGRTQEMLTCAPHEMLTCAPHEMLSMDNCQVMVPLSLGMEPACEAEEVGIDHPLSICDEGPTSSAVVEEAIPVETGDGTGESNEVLRGNIVEIDSSVDIGSEKLMLMSSGNFTDSSDKINIEGPFDETCESDSYQDDKVQIDAIEKTGEPQEAGYDSQFEDGELRESDVHCWEDNEGEGADIEQLDYGSDCDGERFFSLELEDAENKRAGSSVAVEKIEQCSPGNAFRDHLTSSKTKTLETVDGSKIKNHTVDCEDRVNSKEFTSRVVGPRALKRDLPSHIQGSLSTDAPDSVQRKRSDDFDDVCPRSVRGAGLNKFMGRDRYALDMQCRSPGTGHFVSSRRSPTYHGPYGSSRPRPRNVIEGRGFVTTSDRAISDAEAVEGFDSRVRRQYLSSSSNSGYWPFNRRYVAYRDDFYGTHTGTALVRDDVNPDRSRFRKYPQGVSRGIREEFRRPIPNYSSEYADHMPYRMSRRERSISPPSGERLHYSQPYKKSRSRSRSRSPSSWLLLRERNEGSRRRSRSPNFRSARMDRVRLPFQKRFVAEYEEGFVSPPRNRFSPQRHSRFDDRISGLDNFRDRKSPPMRIFRQSQRFDSVRSIRPMVHPRRLADMGSGREYKYEGGEDDRRKQGNRYEMMPRVRRHDADGVMRRLRYNNAEDSFVGNDS